MVEGPLTGARRALLRPSILAGLFGAGLGLYYVVLSLHAPPEQTVWLVALALALMGLVAGTIALSVGGRLETLSRVASGELPPTPANLVRALQEVRAAPDLILWRSLGLWAVGAVLLAAGGLVVLERDVEVFLRILLAGLLLAPMNAMAAYFLASLGGRRAVRMLGDMGLTPQEVIAAVPPVREQLRARLMAFGALIMVVPAVLTADISSTYLQRGLENVARIQEPELQREQAAHLRTKALGSMLAMAGFLLVLAMGTAYLGGTALGEPIRDIAELATRIAAGDLGSLRTISADDEVWTVSAALTGVQVHLAQVLGQLQRAGSEIGAATEQIVETSRRYEAGAAAQAGALNQTSATTEELAQSGRQIADNAGSVADIAHRTLGAAQRGQASADTFASAMVRMRHDNQAIAAAVVKLSSRVQQIGKIVEFINAVANKSDLLALSAELEGTKAGEVGRGFSLVAAEMRRLAENVLESTKEIESLIEEIREATQAAVAVTEAGVKATDAGGSLALQVSESLREIVGLAEQTSMAVRAISLATQQQQTGTDQLAEAMADILRVTRQSLKATGQVTTANADLSVLARELRAAVGRFRVGGS